MRLKNSIYIHLYTENIETSVGFYRNSLSLFEVFQELGPRQLLMKFKMNDSIFIMLNKIDSKPTSNRVVFTLNVDNLDKVHERLVHCDELYGASFLCEPEKAILEYPLERNFALDDPSGNRLVISSGLNIDQLK